VGREWRATHKTSRESARNATDEDEPGGAGVEVEDESAGVGSVTGGTEDERPLVADLVDNSRAEKAGEHQQAEDERAVGRKSAKTSERENDGDVLGSIDQERLLSSSGTKGVHSVP
jgi:hypothetical protein